CFYPLLQLFLHFDNMHGKKSFRINRVSNEKASSYDQYHHCNNQDHRLISLRSLISNRECSTCRDQRRRRSIFCEVNRSRSTYRNTGRRRSVSYDDDRDHSTHQDLCPILYENNRVLYNSPRWSDDSNGSLSRSFRLYKNSEINEIETINLTLKHLIKEVEVLKSMLQVQSTCLNKGKGSVTLESPEGYVRRSCLILEKMSNEQFKIFRVY
ncbi:6445_t:CDS:2, partial [Funneliformis caledonium]